LLAVILTGSSGFSQAVPATSAGAPRQFAPGVVQQIPPDIRPEELVGTHDLIEIRADESLRWDPEILPVTRTLYDMADDVKFRRAVWCLEFGFKPLRMVYVDVPQPNGTVERKLIWYLVYRVRHPGTEMVPVRKDEGTYEGEPRPADAIRFVPSFVLEGHDRNAEGDRLYQAYLDRIIPAAFETIRQRETPHRRLLTTVEMAEELLKPGAENGAGEPVWGVAMWEGVDPRIDFFSVFVGGLTNAYRWLNPTGEFQPGDPPGKGQQFIRKHLQLNFWRPGDEYLQNEREIRFGVPLGKAHLYDVGEGVAYRWVYR
jgi:hypothetical protein